MSIAATIGGIGRRLHHAVIASVFAGIGGERRRSRSSWDGLSKAMPIALYLRR